MDDFTYVTPQEYMNIQSEGDSTAGFTLEELTQRATAPTELCLTCGVNSTWRLVGIGMCFPCVTGSADTSEDYELKAPLSYDEP